MLYEFEVLILSVSEVCGYVAEQNFSLKVSGVLYKWTNFVYGWQKRYFELEQGVLVYYKSEAEKQYGSRGSIALRIAHCVCVYVAKQNFRLKVSGVLYKWTNFVYGWQKRYFELEQGVLVYYKSEAEKHIRKMAAKLICGCIQRLWLQESDIDMYRFDVVTGSTCWSLKVETQAARRMWLRALKFHMTSYNGLSVLHRGICVGKSATYDAEERYSNEVEKFNNPKACNSSGDADFEQSSFSESDIDMYRFDVVTGSTCWSLKVETQAARRMWLRALKFHMTSYNGLSVLHRGICVGKSATYDAEERSSNELELNSKVEELKRYSAMIGRQMSRLEKLVARNRSSRESAKATELLDESIAFRLLIIYYLVWWERIGEIWKMQIYAYTCMYIYNYTYVYIHIIYIIYIYIYIHDSKFLSVDVFCWMM
ncbi:unnamed protein product [Gongylonema pulchrum]|uniref:PH domain-containing protein n=1 Tax=Gongylonema pulchrum TaxID=637853 RepID=A0A3P7PCY0_9BILA|nr:unnamed protein product [Gongylonema pulchrum]